MSVVMIKRLQGARAKMLFARAGGLRELVQQEGEAVRRHARLAAWAIGVGGVCFVVGMALAVITDNPLF